MLTAALMAATGGLIGLDEDPAELAPVLCICLTVFLFVGLLRLLSWVHRDEVPPPGTGTTSSSLLASVMQLERCMVQERPVNFKRVTWSPDGSHILAVSDNNLIEVYNEEYNMSASYSCPGNVNDAVWYPWMNKCLSGSNCFLICSHDQPLKLLDGITGLVRSNYRPVDHKDELDSCSSCAFAPDGHSIYAGSRERIYTFEYSASTSVNSLKTRETRRSREGQGGVISCLAPRWDDTGVLAAGSFSGSIGIYDMRSADLVMLLPGACGVTQLQFDRLDGMRLYSAHRHLGAIQSWDLRNAQTTSPLQRNDNTNQRIYFTTDGNRLFTGSCTTGELLEYSEMQSDSLQVKVHEGLHGDRIGAVSLHPTDSSRLLTCSGQRHYDPLEPIDNSIKIWRV